MGEKTESTGARLRHLYDAWIGRTNDATVAQQRATMAAAEFELAVAEEKQRLRVPPGFEIDVLGDGTVKAAADCKKAGP